MKHMFLIALIVFAPVVSAFTEQVVFNSMPATRTDSFAEKTIRQTLSDGKRNEARLLITKIGDQYFWATRENVPLVYTVSGAFHIFTDSRGGGYVKIFDTEFLPKSVREPGPRYQYMEHATLWLSSITYWGTSDKFEP